MNRVGGYFLVRSWSYRSNLFHYHFISRKMRLPEETRISLLFPKYLLPRNLSWAFTVAIFFEQLPGGNTELIQTSKMDFYKVLYLRCLTGFEIRLWASSYPENLWPLEVSYKKVVLKNITNFTGKQLLRWFLFFNKLQLLDYQTWKFNKFVIFNVWFYVLKCGGIIYPWWTHIEIF